MIQIYANTGELLIETEVLDSSSSYRSIDGRHELTLKFSLESHKDIPIGSWCMFDGARFEVMSHADVTVRNTKHYEYSVLFKSDFGLLSRFKIANPVDGRLSFDMVAKPHEFVELIVSNLNGRDEGWSVGECIDSAEKLVSFSHTSCEDALISVAETFETEYEVVGKTISLKKVEYNKETPLALEYGKGKGFRPGIGRGNFEDGLPTHRMFIEGGDRNISYKDYGSETLHLPKSYHFLFDGEKFDGEEGFDAAKAKSFATDENGYSVFLTEGKGGKEDSIDVTEIYPSRVGTVSAVVFNLRTDKFDEPQEEWSEEDWNNVQVDIVDDTIPEELDFKQCLIGNDPLTVIFQSGELSGREFDASFIKSGNVFELEKQEYSGLPMPQGLFIPKKGDTYAVFNVFLPESYISNPSTHSGAEFDALRAATRSLYDKSEQKFTFRGELDPIFTKKDWVNIGGKIKIGGYVSFTHRGLLPDGPALVRIVGITQTVNNPYTPKIELSNMTHRGSVSSRINQIENSEAHVDELHKTAKRYTKVRFADALRSISMLEEAFGKGFTESVRPATVQTMMMLVGDESLQFMFVESMDSMTRVAHSEYFDTETRSFKCDEGFLKHMTLGIKELHSGYDQNYRCWSIPAYESAVLTDEAAEYYVYASVERDGSNGEFRLESSPIDMYEVDDRYYLLLGLLLAESDGSRSYMPLYGFTQILPGQITTDVIRSADGKTYFDLVQGLIGGRIQFASGSSGLDNLAEWAGKQSQIDKALNDAQEAAASAALAESSVDNLDTKITGIEEGVNESIREINQKLDGVVESYFDDYTPSRSNLPASEWVANGTEEEHVGDTFTNTALTGDDAGKSWRWLLQSNGTYDWQQIADSDAAKALALAGQAQATADGKSKTFLVKPSNYSYGDLWIVGSDYVPSGYIVGDLLSASASSSTFVASHWKKKVKYTDDTAADAAQEAADNAGAIAEDAKSAAEDARSAAENAQSIAEKAQGAAELAQTAAAEAKSEAQEASSVLNVWASDDYISPMEQTVLRELLAQIKSEYTQITNDADRYGVGKTSYMAAYNAAVTALEKYTKATSDGSSIVVGSDYANISAYYTAKATILDKIASEVKEEAEKAVEDAESAADAAAAADAKAAAAASAAAAANAVAENAKSIADAAAENANKAIQDSEDAKETANNAANIAGNAETLAGEAQKIADEAQDVADEAKQEAQDALADAQEALANANDAKSDATSAKQMLDELTADGMITPVEKQSLKNELAQINADFADVGNEVDKYVIDNETSLWNAFDNAYDLYREDLESKINAEGSVEAGNITELQVAYYSARTTLLNAIYVAAKKAADDAQKAADNAQQAADDAQQAADDAKEAADEAAEQARQAYELANTVDAATKTLDTKIGNVETGLLEEVDEINKKLDGVVENYFEEGAPAIDKYPSSEWVTDTYKKNHLGDTYTNIEEYVDNETTPDAGKSWRWTYTDSEHTGYHWHPIADSDAVKALLAASKAQSAADGKSRTFVNQPYPPYSVGDLWVQGDEGEIMKCVRARSEGSYDASDWAKASKYTDDTVASQALALANEAKNEAGDANSAINTLVGTTLPALEDGIITEAEKIAIGKYINIVENEMNEVTATYDKLSAHPLITDVAKSALTIAYNNVKAAVQTLINGINGAILEEPTHTPANVDILYDTYKTKYAAYSTAIESAYAAIEDVINGKAEEAKDTADAAKVAADAAKLATDNLDDDTKFTVAEKRTLRKALKDINTSETATVNQLMYEVTGRSVVLGNAWKKITDKADNNYRWYVSDMHTASSASITKVAFTVNTKCDVRFRLMSRAEGNYDYAMLSKLDTTLASSAVYNSASVVAHTRGKQGTIVYHTFEDVAPGTHFVTISFRKDGSGNTEPDNGYYYVEDFGMDPGSLGDWYGLVLSKGMNEALCVPAVNAANALFKYLYDNGVWTNVTTDVEEGFREKVFSLFQDYYAEVAIILNGTATADVDYLASALRDGRSIIDGGLMLSSLVAVSDTAKSSDAEVVGVLNGSSMANDVECGRLVMALGIPTETSDGNSDFEERMKEANTKIYENGKIVVDAPNVGGRSVIDDNGFVYYGVDTNGNVYPKLALGNTCQGAGGVFYAQDASTSFCVNTALLAIGSETTYAFVATGGRSIFYDDVIISTTLQCNSYSGDNVSVSARMMSVDVPEGISITDGFVSGLRRRTRVISSSGSTSARTLLTDLDYSVLITLTTGTCYLSLPSSPKEGQEYIIESKGAGLNLSSTMPVYSLYSGMSAYSVLQSSGRWSLKFTWYKGLHWVVTILYNN